MVSPIFLSLLSSTSVNKDEQVFLWYAIQSAMLWYDYGLFLLPLIYFFKMLPLDKNVPHERNTHAIKLILITNFKVLEYWFIDVFTERFYYTFRIICDIIH